MAERIETESTEPKMEEITEKIDAHDSPSSPDSDSEKLASSDQSSLPEKADVSNISGRHKKPVHQVLGGGKPADVFLWRNKKVSASVLGVSTAIWALFELLEYHLITFLCYMLILALGVLFLWSNAHAFIHKTPPDVPDVHICEEPFLQVASALRTVINQAIVALRAITSGRDVKKFLAVAGGLWMLSVVGSWCNFLTLLYTVVVLLHTVPVVYEKHEDKVQAFGEKAVIEMKRKYAVFDEKVVSKICEGPLNLKRKLKGKKD